MRMNTPPREDDLIESLEEDDILEFVEIDDLDSFEDEVHESAETESNEADNELETDDVTEMADIIFKKHRGSVFSCSISPNKDIAASGGEDDIAYVWDTVTADTLFTITGHRDSVICVQFSHDGGLLATGDMSGYIQVYKISTQTKMWDFETNELNWILWHRSSNILFAGTGEGEVWMWLIPQGNTKSLPSYGTATQCGALTHDGKRLVVGYDDGALFVFDLKTGAKNLSICDGSCHVQPVISLVCHKDNTLVLTGSMDGTAKLVNSVTGKVLSSFDCNIANDEAPERDHTVEVTSFCPTMPNLAVTATLSGFISIWDLSTTTSRHHIIQGCGSSSIIWHPNQPTFYVPGLDGILRSYDVRSGDLLNQFTGHRKSILDAGIKKDGRRLITSSDDGTARIFTSEN